MAKSIPGALRTLPQQTLLDLTSAISLQESGDGHWPCGLQDGLMSNQCGPDPAHANLLEQQAKERGLLMSGTYGRLGTGSLRSADLSLSLESRLQQQSSMAKSTLYRLTWKRLATPSGRQISALRASAHRIFGRGYGGWGTPTAQNAKHGRLSESERKRQKESLHIQAYSAGWVTPATRDWKHTPGMATSTADGRNRLDQLPRQAYMASGQIATKSPAETVNSGQLNPAHSRWLMGYPAE